MNEKTRELLAKNVAYIRANCTTPDAITETVLLVAETMLELTKPQPELPNVVTLPAD